MRKSLRWLVRTAMTLALLMAVQFVTGSGNQLLTGSCVNLILAVSACLLGLSGAAVVAAVSPFLAYLAGITPNVLLVPGIALGNLAYVTVIALLYGLLKAKHPNPYLQTVPAMIVGAVCKFLVMYLVVVRMLLPAAVPSPQKLETMSYAMGLLQLFTALIGGGVAAMIAPLLKKAVKD